MKELLLDNKKINVLESWNELKLKDYIRLLDIYEKAKDMLEEQFYMEFISIVSDCDKDFLYNIPIDNLTPLYEIIDYFINNPLQPVQNKEYYFNQKLYSFNEHNKLTTGELIDIKLLQKKCETISEYWLCILAIILRPAELAYNEFGDKEYIVEPYKGDINIINKRKELFLELPVINALYIINSFTVGRG